MSKHVDVANCYKLNKNSDKGRQKNYFIETTLLKHDKNNPNEWTLLDMTWNKFKQMPLA